MKTKPQLTFRQRAEKLPATFTGLIRAASIFFMGTGIALIAHGLSVNSFFHMLPGVNIELGTFILVPAAFLFVFQPIYKEKALWIFGLFWGIDELTWLAWGIPFLPSYVVGQLSLEGWPVYISIVTAFFGLSVYILRKSFRGKGAGLLLLCIVGFAPVWVAATLDVQFLPVIGVDTVRDILIVAAIIAGVRGRTP